MHNPFICIACDSNLISNHEKYFCEKCKKTYPIIKGVPYFLQDINMDQAQTSEAFSFKWNSINREGFEDGQLEIIRDFHGERFGLRSPKDFRKLMKGKIVLDAGVGSGEAENFFIEFPAALYAVDISESVHIAKHHWGGHTNFLSVRADILRLPFPTNFFDIIWSDGVLHHTPDTRIALESCVRVLKPGGLIIFYIYVKKAPVREFTDDLIRNAISHLPPKNAWDVLEPLTNLARDLSRFSIKVQIDKDIPYLGIKAGQYDLQRLLYWYILKFYWNEKLSFEGNNAVNLDWFYPRYAHRHLPDEVRSWLHDLNLFPLHFYVNKSGISVIAQKSISSEYPK